MHAACRGLGAFAVGGLILGIAQTRVGYGYTVNSREINVRREHDRIDNDNGGRVGGDTHLVDEPIDGGDQSVAGRVAYWNAVRTAYAPTAAALTVLEAARNACQTYLDYARRAA